MTKEEIAAKYIPCTCGEIYLSRNIVAPDCPLHAFAIEEAMEEYRSQSNDQEIIEFVEHLGIKGKFKDNEWFTTSELLNMFREQKQKQ